MTMYLDEIIKLPEQVAKLPEVGTMLNTAKFLSDRATVLKSQYARLLIDRDNFLAEVQELWTREERKGTGL
jgi:hypothetical protein